MKTNIFFWLSMLIVLSISLAGCGFDPDDTPEPTEGSDRTATSDAAPSMADDDEDNEDNDDDDTSLTSTPEDLPTSAPEDDEDTGTDDENSQTTINMTRANWDTGWFQAEIYRQLLEELGHDVELADPLPPDEFYPAAAEREFDLWVNGWFPLHNTFLITTEVRGRVQPIGTQVPGGALQGYLIDKATADEFNIIDVAALRNPEIAAEFDRDGDGLADLIGCNEGWGCEAVIEHHLDAYELRNTVEHIQGEYSDLMKDTIEDYEAGESVLFYTWTPNWPLDQLQPGEDVVWLEVPSSTLPGQEFTSVRETSIEELPGCATDPCNMGFPPNDIRVVANTAFIHENPQVEKLLQQVTIPLEDINEQNSTMFFGADSEEDIREQAEDWIADNRQQVDEWLEEAKRVEPERVAGNSLLWQVLERGELICGINSEELPGFNEQQEDGTYAGFDIDFCRVIAVALFDDPEAVEFVPLTEEERFRALEDDEVDVLLIRNVSWTALRDLGMDSPNAGTRLDFGPVILHDGQGFMVRVDSGIQTLADLSNKRICVLRDSPTEQNLFEQLEAEGIDLTPLQLTNEFDVYRTYETGGCDAVTNDVSRLAAQRAEFENPDNHDITGIRISREQMAPVFVEGDPRWRDLVTWAIYATIYAEELEVSTDNVESNYEEADSPEIRRLLGIEGSIGERIGISNDFALNIIQEVGNYGDIYERNLTPIGLGQRGPNKPWNAGEGGLLYAPPFR
jgi:glycine betaine/proline transport system substrate-binding protein